MDNTVLNGEWLARAFQLAYFIQGDKATAVQTVTDAMTLLEVAAAAQDKRLYYTPKGRALARKARTKVSLSEIHLLQRLIYVASEPFERRKEAAQVSLSEEDMITHFIKHLVKIVVKRNSFYVSLGLCRLLHTYTTSQTQEIYNVVIQDPERVKDDYYYRSRKAQLMREIKERFADILQCVKGARGEEKFQTVDSASSYKALVQDCLRMFTPWATTCVMPVKFDAFTEVLKPLSFKDADPDQEHQVEINRIHTLLHFECFSRLIENIGFDSPELKLQIPQFFLAKQDQGGPKTGRKNPMTLNEDELQLIRDNLATQSARRKNVAAGLLRVLVDGKECARFDVLETGKIQFEIGEGAEMIEVRAADEQGDLLLASQVLACDYASLPSQPTDSAIILEAGQKVNFSIKPLANSAGEMDGALVTVAYRETSPARAASLLARQLKTRLKHNFTAPQGFAAPQGFGAPAKSVFAVLLLALSAAVVFFYFQSTRKASPKQANHNGQIVQPPESKEPEKAPQKQNDLSAPDLAEGQDEPPQNQAPPKPQAPRRRATGKDPQPPNPDGLIAYVPDNVRGGTPRLPGLSLGQVKRLAVAAFGTQTLNPQLREALGLALKATGRFDIVETGADAVLKISTRRESLLPPDDLTRATITARLANARGSVIWPVAGKGAGASYQGRPSEIAALIAADILREVQKAERQK